MALRIFNSGSPTGRRRQSHGTFSAPHVADGALAETQIIEIG